MAVVSFEPGTLGPETDALQMSYWSDVEMQTFLWQYISSIMYYVSYKGQYEDLTFSNLGLNNKNAQIICPAYFRGSGTTQFESVMLINNST